MCNDQCLIISDYEVFGRLSKQFTYVRDAHGTTSWLEHFICSYDLHVNIFDMQILYKSPSSDYLPVRAKFILDFLSVTLIYVMAQRTVLICGL